MVMCIVLLLYGIYYYSIKRAIFLFVLKLELYLISRI